MTVEEQLAEARRALVEIRHMTRALLRAAHEGKTVLLSLELTKIIETIKGVTP